MIDTVIANPAETMLKGGNRGFFEGRLAETIRARVAPIANLKVSREQGSIVLRSGSPLNEGSVAAIAEALDSVFGIGNYVFAASSEKRIEAINATAAELMKDKKAGTTFKVETTRGDKSFPMKSPEISSVVGGHVLSSVEGVTVDVHRPDVVIAVRVDADAAYVSIDRREGPGGLPTGTSGTVAVLLSGGIDSPVAAWKVMRRGCKAVLVHFHSYPYVGAASIEKVKRLAAIIGQFQDGAALHLVPFADAQREIVAKADPGMRIILYRRLMLRIAEAIAKKEGAQALVTGDSVGQVASQTLENIAAVNAVASLPVFRPLIGDDKRDIIALAERIGTFRVSIEPQDDCCSAFMPPNPVIRASAERAEGEERRYDAASLVADAVQRTERLDIAPERERATLG